MLVAKSMTNIPKRSRKKPAALSVTAPKITRADILPAWEEDRYQGRHEKSDIWDSTKTDLNTKIARLIRALQCGAISQKQCTPSVSVGSGAGT